MHSNLQQRLAAGSGRFRSPSVGAEMGETGGDVVSEPASCYRSCFLIF
jgi:hypothetical protein